MGQSVILCCTGPSLKQTNVDKLKATGLPLFGLNNAFEALDLDFWMAVDSADQFDQKIWRKDCIKFYAWDFRADKLLRGAKNLFFYKKYGIEKKGHEQFNEDIVVEGPYINFIFEGYTFSMALHMLYWLGFRKVFLVGCDFGGESELSALSRDYEEDLQQTNLRLALECLREASAGGRWEIISATPSSPINQFLPYEPL